MTCIRCGESKRKPAVHTFRRTIAGCSFVANVEVEACERCNELDVPVASMLAFDRAVAAELARHGPVSGDSFRFIRKAIPLQPIELSRMLSVPLETVNRWEAGRREIDTPSWLVVATIALETFDAPLPLLPRIRALREPVQAERVLELAGHAPSDVHVARESRTLRDVLTMLEGAVVLTDVDVAEALGVELGPVRTFLEQLAREGVVEKKEVQPSGAIRWEPRDRTADLAREAVARGLDIDTALPRMESRISRGPLSRPDRVVPVAWRATS